MSKKVLEDELQIPRKYLWSKERLQKTTKGLRKKGVQELACFWGPGYQGKRVQKHFPVDAGGWGGTRVAC